MCIILFGPVEEGKSEKVEEVPEKKRGDIAKGDQGERRRDGTVSQDTASQRGYHPSRESGEKPSQIEQDRKATAQTKAKVHDDASAEDTDGKKQVESDSGPESSKTQEPGEATALQGHENKETSPNRDGMGRKRFPPDEIATPSPKKPSLQLGTF